SPIGFGAKPTVYVKTQAPVHLVLWMVKGDYLISAMVKLLPVTAWGTVYLAITLKMSPYILVTACVDGTEIEVHLNVAKFRKVRVPKKNVFRKRPTYQFTLD
ncbi:hypothetical protein BgiBS90_013632, partial [Biomphalaria glabrata]